jgi:peptidyl-tRNA hydrolase, PTH1 family
LGNPGKKYAATRHNVGFMSIDNIAKELEINMDKNKFGGLYGEGDYKGQKIMLIKPIKYINISGEVIKKYVSWFKTDLENVLIICDDLDMDTGKIKLKKGGGSGGHKGLSNIELNLGTKDYNRLKIGISKNKHIDPSVYVLGKLSSKEMKIIEKSIKKATEISLAFCNMTFLELMNKYNRKE